jgi:hypothetical protein
MSRCSRPCSCRYCHRSSSGGRFFFFNSWTSFSRRAYRWANSLFRYQYLSGTYRRIVSVAQPPTRADFRLVQGDRRVRDIPLDREFGHTPSLSVSAEAGYVGEDARTSSSSSCRMRGATRRNASKALSTSTRLIKSPERMRTPQSRATCPVKACSRRSSTSCASGR